MKNQDLTYLRLPAAATVLLLLCLAGCSEKITPEKLSQRSLDRSKHYAGPTAVVLPESVKVQKVELTTATMAVADVVVNSRMAQSYAEMSAELDQESSEAVKAGDYNRLSALGQRRSDLIFYGQRYGNFKKGQVVHDWSREHYVLNGGKWTLRD